MSDTNYSVHLALVQAETHGLILALQELAENMELVNGRKNFTDEEAKEFATKIMGKMEEILTETINFNKKIS